MTALTETTKICIYRRGCMGTTRIAGTCCHPRRMAYINEPEDGASIPVAVTWNQMISQREQLALTASDL